MQHNANTLLSLKTSRAHCDTAVSALSEIAVLVDLIGNAYFEHPHYPLFATLKRLIEATEDQLGELNGELMVLAKQTAE